MGHSAKLLSKLQKTVSLVLIIHFSSQKQNVKYVNSETAVNFSSKIAVKSNCLNVNQQETSTNHKVVRELLKTLMFDLVVSNSMRQTNTKQITYDSHQVQCTLLHGAVAMDYLVKRSSLSHIEHKCSNFLFKTSPSMQQLTTLILFSFISLLWLPAKCSCLATFLFNIYSTFKLED